MITSADPPTDPPLREVATAAVSALWWYSLLRGILLLVLGAYLLIKPGLSAVAFAQVLGILLLAEGILAFAAGVMGRTESRGWTIVRGVLLALLGAFVLAQPVLVAGLAATTILYLVAFGAILGGILDVVAAIRERKEIEGEGWLVLRGLVGVAFGVLLLIAPIAFGLVIIRVLGAITLLAGIVLVILSFRIRTLRKTLKGD